MSQNVTTIWLIFHDFPGLENLNFKSHDFPGSVRTLRAPTQFSNQFSRAQRSVVAVVSNVNVAVVGSAARPAQHHTVYTDTDRVIKGELNPKIKLDLNDSFCTLINKYNPHIF